MMQERCTTAACMSIGITQCTSKQLLNHEWGDQKLLLCLERAGK